MDERTGGQEDGWTGGWVDERTGGQEDGWTGGQRPDRIFEDYRGETDVSEGLTPSLALMMMSGWKTLHDEESGTEGQRSKVTRNGCVFVEWLGHQRDQRIHS